MSKKIPSLHDYTSDQIQEMIQCAADPIYFVSHYCMVQHPVHGVIPFDLYKYQQRTIHAYQEGNTIVLTPRQMGTSTTTCAYVLWYAMFTANRSIMIASDTNGGAMGLMNKIHFMYDNLPLWMQLAIKAKNKHELSFDNGSYIQAIKCSADAGRGMTISLLYCDSFGFVKPQVAKDFWYAILPAMSHDQLGRIIVTSAPNGMNNLYAELWHESKEINRLNHISLVWDECPDRDQAFKEFMQSCISDNKWRSEYECQFITSNEVECSYG